LIKNTVTTVKLLIKLNVLICAQKCIIIIIIEMFVLLNISLEIMIYSALFDE